MRKLDETKMVTLAGELLAHCMLYDPGVALAALASVQGCILSEIPELYRDDMKASADLIAFRMEELLDADGKAN